MPTPFLLLGRTRNGALRRVIQASCAALLAIQGCAEAGTETDTFDGAVLPGNGFDSSFGDVGSDAWAGFDSAFGDAAGWDAAQLGDAGGDAAAVDGGRDGGGSDGAAGDGGLADAGPDPAAATLPKGKEYTNGWTWVSVAGSQCRDGSPAGYYYRLGKSRSLMVYLNGGGACADPFFCSLNPKNVDEDLPIELLIGGAPNLIFGPNKERQIAPEEGIFKRNEPRNPVTDWDMVYVPYCTGDIHAGTNKDVTVKDVAGKQQFVGYTNFGLFLDSFGPSFAGADRVLLTGSSAGGFGSLLNYDRTQQFFDKWQIEVMAITDSGLPMRDKWMSVCLQKRWRDYWGLNNAFPKDCTDCFHADGGGLTEAAFNYYFKKKYKGRMLGGLVTTKADGIIRAFYAPGMSSTAGAPDDCTLEPSINTVTSSFFLGQYDGAKYQAGLKDVLDNLVDPGQIGYYAMDGDVHMHLWRPRFFEKNGLNQTIAEWMKDILAKKATKTGTL